jgi:death-on-curing protein
MKLVPKFLTFTQVLALHQIQIEEFGGLKGIKDEGLLKSALSQPEAGMAGEYFHKDIHEMTSAYLFHLVKNHAFNDGNKRIAALVAAVFLQVNGFKLTANEKDFEKLVLDASQSSLSKPQIADFFRKNTRSN